jgi:hypothetical protein
MVFGIGGAVIVGLVGLVLILPQKIGTRAEKSSKLTFTCVQRRNLLFILCGSHFTYWTAKGLLELMNQWERNSHMCC